MGHIEQMAFDLFHHIKDVFQIEAMSYSQLRYWHKYHEILEKTPDDS